MIYDSISYEIVRTMMSAIAVHEHQVSMQLCFAYYQTLHSCIKLRKVFQV